MTTEELNRRSARGLSQQDLDEAKEDVRALEAAITDAERLLSDAKGARANTAARMRELTRELEEARTNADAAGTAAVGVIIAKGSMSRELLDHAVRAREDVKFIEMARRQMIDRNMPLAEREDLAAQVALAQARVDLLLAKSVMTKVATIISMREVWKQDPSAAISTPAADRLWLEASVLADTDLRPAQRRLKDINEKLAQAA